MDYFRLHPWKVTGREAKRIQRHLRGRLVLGKAIKKVSLIAAADVAYRKGTMYGVVAVFEFPSLNVVEKKTAKMKESFPYVPGLLTFREGPVLLKAFAKIKSEPDVIIFDGQGAAHPERMGEAAHMGILLDRPTIGCAKSKLIGIYKEPKKKKGSHSLLFYDGGVVGAVLRTKDRVKPLFVSPGFKINLKSSIKVILSCCRKYRFPEPIRYVHRLSQELKLGSK